MKKKKMTAGQWLDIANQARHSRDAEWEETHDELAERYENGEIEASEYFNWLDENPRPSAVIEEQARERRRLKRKSKKNVKKNITIVDRDALRDVKMQETKIATHKS